MKTNWRQKLSSRKFWALIAALVVSVMVAFGAGAETTEKVTGVLTAAGACAVYILAEASVDKANKAEEGILLEEEAE